MPEADVFTKNCISQNKVFADVFNFFIYGGRNEIDLESLKDESPEENAIFFIGGKKKELQFIYRLSASADEKSLAKQILKQFFCGLYTQIRKSGIFLVMGKFIVFANQKGGVGKTTSAINIGAYMALAGKKVLLVDFDSQGNMSSGVGVSKDKPTVYELISGIAESNQVIKKTRVQNLDAINASADLSGAAIELVGQEKREFFLKNALSPLRNDYDFVLIDCPPSLGILTLNGLAAADSVLVPMQCEYFALEGITLLLQTVKKVQKAINPSLSIGGIFFTMYDSRIRLANEVVKQVQLYFKDLVFSTIIPRNVRLSEAPSHGLPVCAYDPNCTGAKSYKKLAEEVIQRG